MTWNLRPDVHVLVNRGLDTMLPETGDGVRFVIDTHNGDLELHRAVDGGWRILASVPVGASILVRENGSHLFVEEVYAPLDRPFEAAEVRSNDRSLMDWVESHGGEVCFDGDGGMSVYSRFDRFGFTAGETSLVLVAAGHFDQVAAPFVDDFFEETA